MTQHRPATLDLTTRRHQRSAGAALAMLLALGGCGDDRDDRAPTTLDGVALPTSPETEPLTDCHFPERTRHGDALSALFDLPTACQVFPSTVANRVFRFYADALSRHGWRHQEGRGHIVRFTRDDRRLTLVGLPYDTPPEGQRVRRMVLVFALDTANPPEPSAAVSPGRAAPSPDAQDQDHGGPHRDDTAGPRRQR
ncbi:hypothetical protein EV659_102376 [Rhodothalassium salexigens DSM 2132]|uniref:Uncharacterized protein n=1 Tax=Rhodothalassium salexigens DSM 2132 TaxID=1188247 RepID=A0A4R2PUX5_RHOSA|nr:hypothetical protein [Rhodothalassium salexigens]MBB4210478.1 hypothetical protein [Rhodothalassium salexigens DSM 2132]TCP37965.1 hypothetical protein EV659_102376 [Rhodothalassium salexigens DSM 2132]